MSGDTPTRGAFSLTARLLGLLSFALFPLALISLYQTQTVVNEAETLARTALLSETRRAASDERELLQEAFGAAQGLAAVVQSTPSDSAKCREVMKQFVASSPKFIFVGYIEPSGLMQCSSSDNSVDFSNSPTWPEAAANPKRRLQARREGAVTRESVVIVSQPIMGPDGFAGYISISIPHSVANYLLPERLEFGDYFIATLNADGTVLSASGGLDTADALLPADMTTEEIFTKLGDVFDATTPSGERRKFAVTPIFEGNVHAIGSWPLGLPDAGFLSRNASAPLAFPILMWLVGIAVAWLGLQNLVIRHIKSLRDAMRRFALGERDTPQLALANPPQELAQAELAFNRMVTILTETEERREADLHDKTVLLHEVHHRVKNNLQLIASITNMQMRQVSTPEAHRVLAQLQRRVRALATIHQSMYTTPDLTTIDARHLVEQMVTQMEQIGGRTDHAPRVTTDLSSAMLYPDQAVPLSMLLAEALNNVWKYASASGGGRPDLHITLRLDADEMLHLSVENTQSADAPPVEKDASDGLGTRLMAAFISQLGGTSSVDSDKDFYRLNISFKTLAFSDEDTSKT